MDKNKTKYQLRFAIGGALMFLSGAIYGAIPPFSFSWMEIVCFILLCIGAIVLLHRESKIIKEMKGGKEKYGNKGIDAEKS